MSSLRPECITSHDAALPDDTALFLIRDAVGSCRALIYGRLDDQEGGHCALGQFWKYNPHTTLRSSLIEEVAAVNDSIPPSATPHQRWKKVNSWLRFKIASLTKAAELQARRK